MLDYIEKKIVFKGNVTWHNKSLLFLKKKTIIAKFTNEALNVCINLCYFNHKRVKQKQQQKYVDYSVCKKKCSFDCLIQSLRKKKRSKLR